MSPRALGRSKKAFSAEGATECDLGMHLGAKDWPSKPAIEASARTDPGQPSSVLSTCNTILRQRCLSSALSALNVLFATYPGLADSPSALILPALRTSDRRITQPPTGNHQSPFTSHFPRPFFAVDLEAELR
jgi:hypothetical protein